MAEITSVGYSRIKSMTDGSERILPSRRELWAKHPPPYRYRGSLCFAGVQDAVEYCLDHFPGSHYVFRGQRLDWPIVPRLRRLASSEPGNLAEAKRKTLKFLAWLKSNPRLLAFHYSDDQLLAIAQHYGFATPLLDFTRDANVAGFFATYDPKGEIKNGDKGVIVLLNIRELLSLFPPGGKNPMGQPWGVKIIEVPDFLRLERQAGLFVEGISPKLLGEMGDVRFYFEHQRNEALTLNITERDVFPPPSPLEQEINLFAASELGDETVRYYGFKVLKVGS